MKLNLAIVTLSAICALLFLSAWSNSKKRTYNRTTVAEDSIAKDRAKHLAVVRELIKGKERLPSDSIFRNIKTLKGVPAGRLIAIMDFGYSQSLGVSCGHCHNTNKWESEEKPQKQIAREMSALVNTTRDALKKIEGLKSENPVVNCTTCHRGAIKPALNLNEK